MHLHYLTTFSGALSIITFALMSKNSRRGVYFSLRLRFVKFLWKSLPALAAGLGDGAGGDLGHGCGGLDRRAEVGLRGQGLGGGLAQSQHLGKRSLCGSSIGEILKKLIRTAVNYAKETGAICVLKDACTVTAAPDGNTWISLAGNPGMATAGSGDVLTGILAGVLAMFLNKRTELPDTGRQAALGVLLHGMAGDLAAKEKGTAGMKAGDIVRGASEVLKNK